MRKFIKIEKNLQSPVSTFGLEVGKGAIIYLDLITEKMARFLILEYIKNPGCLSEDVKHLLQMEKKDFEENAKRELNGQSFHYLQNYNSPYL